MNFNEYIESKRLASVKKKIPQEIRERWSTRIISRSLQTLGRSGAVQYLFDYGKGLAAPKAVHLALMAELEGYPEMSMLISCTYRINPEKANKECKSMTVDEG